MSIDLAPILVGLTVGASASPMLTFVRLWQLKEWRIDRLREHLRAEGILRQLFGMLRPAIVACAIVLGIALQATMPWVWTGALAGIACLSVLQIVLRRQPMPVWTMKAVLITATTLLCTTTVAGVLLLTLGEAWLLAVALLQPACVAVAWLLWRPVDAILKRNILRRAARVRAALPAQTVVIGITGSAGKTTTKELLAHVLAEKHPFTTPAHVNTEIGVAQWINRTLPSVTDSAIIIVEMGAYRMGEIALLCQVAQPTMGIVTSVGRQHIALFGSQERLCQAKGELIAALPKDGHAFLNGDNTLCESLRSRAQCAVTVVGTGGRADMEAFDIEETEDGIAFRIEKTHYAVPLHGTHNVTNVLLAIAAARACGMKTSDIAARLRSFVPPAHTFAVRKEQDTLILDDTHNSSPASVLAAIAWARNQPAEEKVLLFSGLIELGESQDRIHAEIGTAAAPVFDRVIVLSPHCRRMVEKGYGKKVELYDKTTPRIAPTALLICVGRMSPRAIQSLLPNSPAPTS
jgi:UDP-N-acetylmuramoyl-tripeptide--D-alanyl-D-alanine ligase